MTHIEQSEIDWLAPALLEQCRVLVDAPNLTDRMAARQAITTIADRLMDLLMARDGRDAVNKRPMPK